MLFMYWAVWMSTSGIYMYSLPGASCITFQNQLKAEINLDLAPNALLY